MENREKRIVVDDKGNEFSIIILLTFEIEERNKKYAVICKEGDEENASLMIVIDDSEENYELREIEDEDEYNEAYEVADALLNQEDASNENY